MTPRMRLRLGNRGHLWCCRIHGKFNCNTSRGQSGLLSPRGCKASGKSSYLRNVGWPRPSELAQKNRTDGASILRVNCFRPLA